MLPSPAGSLRALRRARSSVVRRALAVSVTVLALGALRPRPVEAQLAVYHLDVGQGDATLLILPDHRAILIDAGPMRHAVSAAIRPLLDRAGVHGLVLAVASHAHADHIGGMADVLADYPVTNYLDNGTPLTTATYRHVMDAVERRHITYLRATPRTLTVGAVTVQVLPMPPDAKATDQNNQSVGLVVRYGRFSVLFPGDAEVEERAFWRAQRVVGPVTVLKVAHHGSSNGTDAPWLAAVHPAVAVISVAAVNDYGHPAPGVESLLAAARIQTLRTDRVGTVLVVGQADGTFAVRTTGPQSAVTPGPRGRGRRTSRTRV